MNRQTAIDLLESHILSPGKGLPLDIFHFVTRLTPMINVDLLIRNARRGTLLTWRDDGVYPAGWHVPGGIIRFKESLADRIHAVARTELGARVSFAESPLALNELREHKRRTRGHFISLLYACRLETPPDTPLSFEGGSPRPGQWAWHRKCPADLMAVHRIYREYIGAGARPKRRLFAP